MGPVKTRFRQVVLQLFAAVSLLAAIAENGDPLRPPASFCPDSPAPALASLPPASDFRLHPDSGAPRVIRRAVWFARL